MEQIEKNFDQAQLLHPCNPHSEGTYPAQVIIVAGQIDPENNRAEAHSREFH